MTEVLNLQENIRKLLRVSDDIHRMTEFVMEIREASIVIGLLAVIGIIIYAIIKISRKHMKQSREYKRRFENMMETLSTVNTRTTIGIPYASGRPELWHTERTKRCLESDGDFYGASVQTPIESLEDIGAKLQDLKDLNANTSKSLRH